MNQKQHYLLEDLKDVVTSVENTVTRWLIVEFYFVVIAKRMANSFKSHNSFAFFFAVASLKASNSVSVDTVSFPNRIFLYPFLLERAKNCSSQTGQSITSPPNPITRITFSASLIMKVTTNQTYICIDAISFLLNYC
jgi:hypothetical protein